MPEVGGINRAVFAKLVVGDWNDRNENLLVTGATGLRKRFKESELKVLQERRRSKAAGHPPR